MYETSPVLWVRLASLQFIGPATRWLSSLKSTIRKFTWSKFCQEVVTQFGRNQHQSLIRCLYKLVQTGTVADYVQQFAELMDQLSAYEEHPDMLHYVLCDSFCGWSTTSGSFCWLQCNYLRI
jgi:hypothetical protein